jgi:predicted enzyme related to lactoylglutathione lyase
MANAPRGLQVGIIVGDLELTTPFYRDGLGLSHVADVPLPYGLMRQFACGDAIVKIAQPNEAPSDVNPPGGILAGVRGLRWFTLMVDHIEEVVARCEAAGGSVQAPIIEFVPGLKVGVVEDPEGNCAVELVCRETEAA